MYSLLIMPCLYEITIQIRIYSVCEKFASAGMPFRFTWSPFISIHASILLVPARGNVFSQLNPLIPASSSAIESLPVAESLLPNGLIEFYLHPNNSIDIYKECADTLITASSRFQ